MIRNLMLETSPLIPGEQVRLVMAHIAESDSPVLILGEHGVGKRSVARQLHALSFRRQEPYTEVSCADLDEESLHSSLSTSGILHLYEIAELSLPLQELVLQFYLEIQPGAPACRLLLSSSREPVDEVRSQRMNEQFYFFASAVTLRIPPLRYRKFEIPAIVDELMTRFAAQFDRPKPVLGGQVMEFLVEYSWPGNLIELQTAIKTFVAIEDQAISFAALRAPGQRYTSNHTTVSLKDAARAASSQIERQLISEVLAATGGNRRRAADELGISYKALLYKIKQQKVDLALYAAKTGVTP
jgi:two-component system response regulator PilR (NtrC family)